MLKKAEHLEYRLEVIDGYMRPVFEGKEKEWNELMWELLVPFPASGMAMLEEIELVESGELEEWSFESPEARITCTPKSLTLEEKLKADQKGKPVVIRLNLRKVALLMRRWLFECVVREQQRRGQAGGGQFHQAMGAE